MLFPPPQALSASHTSTLTSTGHTPELSVAVLKRTCAYTSVPFQALTSSTISSLHGEESLDLREVSSHRQVQTDEVFTRLPASFLARAHRSLGRHLNRVKSRYQPLDAGNHCRVVGTTTSDVAQSALQILLVKHGPWTNPCPFLLEELP